MSSPLPTAALAATKVQQAMGWKPVKISRFTTGTSHYVFEVFSPAGTSIVIRMGKSDQTEEMAEHGQTFNGNERPSKPEVRTTMVQIFTEIIEQVSS